jgi:hypothetical protein
MNNSKAATGVGTTPFCPTDEVLRSLVAQYYGEALDLAAADIAAVLNREANPPGRHASLVADWRTSREGRRAVRVTIRKALHDHGLPPTGALFDALVELAVRLQEV